MPGKRDSKYYSERLESEHPEIFSRLKSGEFASVREAAIEAGIVKAPSPLIVLRREWKKANRSERDAFLAHIGIGSVPPAPGVPISSPLDDKMRLTAEARVQIKAILARRGITGCDAAYEMGQSRYNASIGQALINNYRITKIPAHKIADWISKNLPTVDASTK